MIGLPGHMPDIKPMAPLRSHKPAAESLSDNQIDDREME